MTRLLAHRGPVDEGFFEDDTVGLGMRRLAIIDLEGGRQPMASETGEVRVVFNGEIYNYRELRSELEEKGHLFATRSDTEVLVHGYEEWGDELPLHLRGMFAFAVWDARRRRLLLVRDHFGIKPLYYAQARGVVFFASEIKSILGCPGVSRELDLEGLDRYLSFLYVPEPATIFRAVRALPPAHSMTCEDGRVSMRRFWEFRPESGRYRTRGEAVEEIQAALKDSVQAMLVADVPVGLFLSGGMDSTSILAMMARRTEGPVRTFSIGFGAQERHWDELGAARGVASHFETDHREFLVEPDVVELLPKVVSHFDQPFANPTAVILYLLSRETARHVKVALAGTGGDEMFGGYPRYAGVLLYRRYRRLPLFVRRGVAELARHLGRDAMDGRLGPQRARRFLEGGALSSEECYVRFLVTLDGERKRSLYSAQLRQALASSDTMSFIRPLLEDGGGVEESERPMLADVNTYLPFNQLAYADRMSMAHSLEVRVPFVDQRLVEVAGGIPLEWKIPRGVTKGLFRQAMTPLLPRQVVRAPKVGLNLPIALWFRRELRGWVRSLLSEDLVRQRGYFRPEAVSNLLDEHDSGRRDHSLFIWAMVVLEVWHRLYLEG